MYSPPRSSRSSRLPSSQSSFSLETDIASLTDPALCKLRDRIQLRKLFENISPVDSDGNISSTDLIHSIKHNDIVKNIFTQRQLNDLIMFSHTNKRVKDRGKLSWNDLIEYVNLIETRQKFNVSDRIGNIMIQEPPAEIPLESLALEIEVNSIIDKMAIIVMDQKDERLNSNSTTKYNHHHDHHHLSGFSGAACSSLLMNTNRLILNSKTSSELLVEDVLKNMKIDRKWKGDLQEKVSDAILTCCRKELFNLLDGIRVQYIKCRHVYDLMSRRESSHLTHLEIREERNQVREKFLNQTQKVANGDIADQKEKGKEEEEEATTDDDERKEEGEEEEAETSISDSTEKKLPSCLSNYVTDRPQQMELAHLMQALISIQQDILKKKEELKRVSGNGNDSFFHNNTNNDNDDNDDDDDDDEDDDDDNDEDDTEKEDEGEDDRDQDDEDEKEQVDSDNEKSGNDRLSAKTKEKKEASLLGVGLSKLNGSNNRMKEKTDSRYHPPSQQLKSTEEILERLRQEHNRFSTIMEFQRIDVDGDGSISRQEWRQWMNERAALIKALNYERAQILNENARFRLALNLNDTTMASEQESFDLERSKVKAAIMKEKLQMDALQKQIQKVENQLKDSESFMDGLGITAIANRTAAGAY